MSQFAVVARPVSRRQVVTGAGVLALSACSGQRGASGGARQPTGTPRRGGTLTFAANASTATEKLDPQKADGPSKYVRNVSVFDRHARRGHRGWLENSTAAGRVMGAERGPDVVTFRPAQGCDFYDLRHAYLSA
ncbi:MAG: hypothetical protein ABIZ05_10920 [Pseudonocardiaceae bacterium]